MTLSGVEQNKSSTSARTPIHVGGGTPRPRRRSDAVSSRPGPQPEPVTRATRHRGDPGLDLLEASSRNRRIPLLTRRSRSARRRGRASATWSRGTSSSPRTPRSGRGSPCRRSGRSHRLVRLDVNCAPKRGRGARETGTIVRRLQCVQSVAREPLRDHRVERGGD